MAIVPVLLSKILTKTPHFLQYVPMNSAQSTITLDAHVLDLLLAFLDHHGLDLPDYRAHLHLLKGSNRLPIETWWSLLDSLHQHEPREDLGLLIGQCIQPQHAGVLGYLGLYSATLGQALMRFHRFQPLLHNLVPTEFRVDGMSVVLGWSTTRRSTRLSDDVVGSGLMRFAQILTGRSDVKPSWVRTPNPPPRNKSAYQEVYGCPIEFASPVNEIHFPATSMTWPVNSQDPYLSSLIERQAEAMLQALPQEDPLLKQVQQCIMDVMQDGPPEMDAVAARMGMAERSLYRALQQRSIRFKNLVNTTRFELAKDYLRSSGLSLPEIALLLGFADQSVFSRSFKTWSGESPLRWRKQITGNLPM